MNKKKEYVRACKSRLIIINGLTETAKIIKFIDKLLAGCKIQGAFTHVDLTYVKKVHISRYKFFLIYNF